MLERSADMGHEGADAMGHGVVGSAPPLSQRRAPYVLLARTIVCMARGTALVKPQGGDVSELDEDGKRLANLRRLLLTGVTRYDPEEIQPIWTAGVMLRVRPASSRV